MCPRRRKTSARRDYLGANRYGLAVAFDKSSNWLTGLEKGFMVFKRPVPAGAEANGRGCEIIDRDEPGDFDGPSKAV